MPRTFGDALIHISHVDYAVNLDVPLPEHGGAPPSEAETKIGQHIASNLVDDGATLQMGMQIITSNSNHTYKSYYLPKVIQFVK